MKKLYHIVLSQKGALKWRALLSFFHIYYTKHAMDITDYVDPHANAMLEYAKTCRPHSYLI